MEHAVQKNSDEKDDLVIYREFSRQEETFKHSEAKLGTKLEK